jgi:hypothetical protein
MNAVCAAVFIIKNLARCVKNEFLTVYILQAYPRKGLIVGGQKGSS